MYFVGNPKAPLAIGNKGELFDLLDDRFFEIYEVFRFIRSGMYDIRVEDQPYSLSIGVRTLMEISK